MTLSDFHTALHHHDERIAALGLDIWIGMEPTFTQRHSENPEWLSKALGPEKPGYAAELVDAINKSQPGGVIMHSLGRQYEGEDLPRWSIGFYRSRSDHFNWKGPADPLFATKNRSEINLGAFRQTLTDQLNKTELERPWKAQSFQIDGELNQRILLRCDGQVPVVDLQKKPTLARPSVHSHKIPLRGLVDDLARQGDFLISLDTLTDENERQFIVVELPAISSVATFVQLLHCLSNSAFQCHLNSLRMQGFPPPVDETVSWTTMTPDPAVLEINMAPSSGVLEFFEQTQRYYQAAESIGLSPYRLQYNGVVSDSGGGGQFTIGASSALNSPFLHYPKLLPRLIRYLNAHPALSYWFAPPSVGSFSQSPRLDEGVRDSFQELKIALEQLEETENPSAEFIWSSLSPFLVDTSGNQHRSELNVEKLWNPYLPNRGCLGLVEFRAFRMPRSPEAASAIATLLRALVAMLIEEDKSPLLIEHGDRLHDKYALPFFLAQDLIAVFEDLRSAAMDLGKPLESRLLDEPLRTIAQVDCPGYSIKLDQALEFWPLLGDSASQERGGSRLMDSSTSRLQLIIRPQDDDPRQIDRLQVQVEGYHLPMRRERDRQGPLLIIAIRFRNFMPFIGLHPGIAPLSILHFLLTPNNGKRPLELALHDWHPDGVAYPGLPKDLQDAEQRRRERLVVKTVDSKQTKPPAEFPAACFSDYCVDLRHVSIRG